MSFTGRAAGATAYFFVSATLSGWVALLAMRLLGSRPWSARMAAALLLLLAGTAGFAALFMTIEVIVVYHDLSEVPPSVSLMVFGLSGAGTLYDVLTVGAPLILPVGLPIFALFAFLIARRSR
jgi:hypothetical protein